GDILSKYFKGKSNILTSKTLAETFLLYYPDKTNEEVKNLVANKKTLATTLGWSAEDLEPLLYSIMFRKAAKAYSNTEIKDSFVAVFRSIDPASVEYAKKDLDIRIALLAQEDPSQATQLLSGYLTDTENPAGIKAIAGWILDFAMKYTDENFVTLAASLSQYTLKSQDKGFEYWLYLAELLCAEKTGDTAKAKTLAVKAFGHASLPDEYKKILKEKYNL
ncbi:MAG: hypothetical protein IPP93_18165, partial [Chitinophagaceae bacterium]|nr:hypothetical protein [Chitinophagaceae bacterium]